MKKIITSVMLIIVVMFLATCSSRISTEELSRQVGNSIKEDFANNEMLSGLKVGNVQLVNTDGNNYSGIVKVFDEEGQSANLDVNVIYDGKYFKWEIPESSMINLIHLNW